MLYVSFVDSALRLSEVRDVWGGMRNGACSEEEGRLRLWGAAVQLDRSKCWQASKIDQNWQNFVNFWRARSRLYRNEILQENMRSTAFFKLYKICILLHRCNLKRLAKKSV